MARLLFVEREGNLIKRYYDEDGITYCHTFDAAAPSVLLSNQQVRLNPNVLKKQDGYRWAMTIPEDDWTVITRKYPDLLAADRQLQDRAMRKFMASDESLPYRVIDWKRGGTA